MGGSATNSGINYQQRIASLALIAQFTDFDLSQIFGINDELLIESVHFETDDPIDDLKILCKTKTIFLQIKRSLSFQIGKNSDLFKTIKQFLVQFSLDGGKNSYYVLATSPQSSRVISQELLKIIESVRLNDTNFIINPLNKSEKDTFTKYKSMFKTIFSEINGKPSSDADFINFTKKIYISIIDIEQGRADERVAIILLKSQQLVDANLIWKMMIANSLEYARNRQSINKKGLDEILSRYKNQEKETIPNNNAELEELFKTEVIQEGNFPVAKEILLVELQELDTNYLIMELYRFTDDGKIKHKFKGNKILLHGTDETWTILSRAATFSGIERYIKENEEKLTKEKITIIPANGIETAEETVAAELHRKYLINLQEQNHDLLKCLHCDKALNPNNSIIVEIDDLDTRPALGAVHPKCVRVLDRVLGTTKTPEDNRGEYLKEFDYKEWARLMMKGQGMMNQLRESNSLNEKNKMILWNGDNKEFRDYSYCLKFNLSDGSSRHMLDRGRIHRFSKLDAIDIKNDFEENIKKSKSNDNPIGYTSTNFVYGNYNQLLELKSPEESIIEIETVEVARYSKLLEKIHEHINFYAPICIVRDREDESIFNIGNLIPMISDPLVFLSIVETWNNLDIEFDLDSLELKIIKSDLEFDSYMREFFSCEMVPIIDPLFNKKRELVKGIRVANMHSLTKSETDTRTTKQEFTIAENPKWKKGDKVRVEFPNITDDNYPVGILLEDEVILEDERFVIFCPIENGKELKELTYSIPSKFLVKRE
ncbi:MAG: hypothetical protein N4A35_02875 [Flavobacteriales bacterium]|jgi:hypothetical protein|nr:hypothetical protein [Flavobacteriales bacterium]